ncbi:MAG TPA: peptidoglycan bridge formation glycyltransferase FemA/FemB family protein [Spirochaetia bacterium]|nr:peptidoglycan bridge formation glycyltransferase FemA/FemB family protein [Spirochaetia bacterium]
MPLSALDESPELLQSGFWGAFKQEFGWKPLAFEIETAAASSEAPVATFGLLVLTRRLARRFWIAYVPFGPTHDPGTRRGELLSAISGAVRPFLPRGTLFLRFDLPWPREGENPGLRRPGALAVEKSPNDMQPASTVVVDISGTPEVVLGRMKSKTRYNIRLAEKKGVSVTEGSGQDLARWYAIYQETARRDRIGIHSLAYYEGLLGASRSYPGKPAAVQLLLAWHEGELLAGNVVAFWKTRAAYLYGASSGVKRNLMPTYALQWEAMQRARSAGCTSYDLFGVPPRPDPGHPMAGLYQFKTGFSEQVLERWGTWDVRYRPVLCALYRAAEAVRMFYYRRFRKRLRGPQAAAAAADAPAT